MAMVILIALVMFVIIAIVIVIYGRIVYNSTDIQQKCNFSLLY